MGEQVVIVTGAGRGIGRAICERFATRGTMLVAASRTASDLEETKHAIERADGKCHVALVDVASADDVEGLVEDTVDRFGRIDVLVNNAGVAPLAKLEDLDPAVFRSLMAVNVDALYFACRAVWPVMRGQGGGVIVNMSSIA